MKRLLVSRKMWGALLGSLSIALIVYITPKDQIATTVMVVGTLWSFAIGGQAIGDGIKTFKNQQ